MKRIVAATILSMLTVGSASAQMYMGGPGPGYPFAMTNSMGGPEPNLYPIRRYIVRRTPVYVQPGPIIINNSRVNIDNKRVYIKNKNVTVRRVYPRPVVVAPPQPYTIVE